MGDGVLRIDGNGPSEGLYGFVYFAFSGKLFAPDAVAYGLVPLARPPSFLGLPAAFSSIHPIQFPCALKIPRDHSD